MFLEILKAFILAGIPVMIISFYLVKLTDSKSQRTASNSTELKKVKKDIKKNKITQSEDQNTVQFFIYKNWMKFGGGFYGVMAFITYIHIEIYQIIEFAQNFKGIQDFLDQIGFSMLINFFIEAIMNMVTAFIWFTYWPDILPIVNTWLWILVVIVAHTLGTKYAIYNKNKTNNNLVNK